MDYSLIYTLTFSVLMSISACAALVCTGLKLNYSPFKCFVLLCIPKTVFSIIRYYFENYESNFVLLIILILSMMLFDVIMLFVIFDSPMIQKALYIGTLDIVFMPVLLVKQAFETNYLSDNNTLVFDSFFQLLIPLISYVFLFTGMVILVHFLGKLINKINFRRPIFDIFGVLALFGYLSIELVSVVMYWENIVGRENQFLQYFNCALVYCISMLIMYIISTFITKRRLMREIEVLNKEKEQDFKYYNLMKTHNEEIRKIKHDLNGHFDVLNTFLKEKEYDKIDDYISSLSDNYSKIKRVVYTSNLLADAVITSAVEKCEQNSIDFECEGFIEKDCFIDDVSLTCIFSNILDNAIEACIKTDGRKHIKLSIFNKSECIVINCINTKDESAKPKENFFSSTKTESGHGFGIRIIKEIVSSYDGIVNFADKGKEFEISLLIPQNINVKK